MIMADVFAIVFVILGFLLAFPALWLTLNSLFPKAAARCEERVRTTPIRSFFIGIPVLAMAIVISVGLGATNRGPFQFLSALLLAGTFIASGVGVAGLARHIGSRMPSPVDEKSPWRMLLRGAIALELSYLLPFAGWFLILPISWVTGLGAVTITLLSRAPATSPVPEAMPYAVPVTPTTVAAQPAAR